MIGRHWTELDTPRLVVDADRLEVNIAHFHDGISRGVGLRSHIKTHKSVDIALMQVSQGAVGIAAAKTSEAVPFVDAGITDVVIAYPIFGDLKWRRAAELARRCDRFVVHAENPQAVDGLSNAAVDAEAEIGIRVEIDSGFHRTGVDATGAIELASLISDRAGVYFDGVTTHRSIFFPGSEGRDLDELGEEEGRFIVDVADEIRAAGITVDHVVAGSTPTASSVSSIDGMTEVCAGTYVFYDAGMVARGAADLDSLALSIPATVVVAHEGREIYTIDAGAKTLTKDQYPGSGEVRYGVGLDRPDDVVVGVTDEHGIVATRDSLPNLGEVIRFFPIHVCPTVNLADELLLSREGVVESILPVSARGRNT